MHKWRQTDRQTDRQTERQTDRQKQRDRETETQRRNENSDIYYTRIKILGSCMFLQAASANLHANRLHIKQQ